MEKSIKLAIDKGGYEPEGIKSTSPEHAFTLANMINPNFVVLDPAFWQALGRALGWNIVRCDKEAEMRLRKEMPEVYKNIPTTGDYDNCSHCHFGATAGCKEHIYHALRFFELKLTGGEEEKFWEDLINKP